MGVDWASHAVTTAWTAGTPFIFVSKSDITKDEVEKALDKHFGEGYYQLAVSAYLACSLCIDARREEDAQSQQEGLTESENAEPRGPKQLQDTVSLPHCRRAGKGAEEDVDSRLIKSTETGEAAGGAMLGAWPPGSVAAGGIVFLGDQS